MSCPIAGDSACSIPPQTIPQQCLDVIRDWTPKIARELKVIGLINIQYAIQDNQVRRAPQSYPATKLVLLAYLALQKISVSSGGLALHPVYQDQLVCVARTTVMRPCYCAASVQCMMLLKARHDICPVY